MPQTVPSAGLSPPCAYSFTADSFDLSLLSPDGEVPVSPPSLRHLMNLFGDPTTSPEPMFSSHEEEDYAKGLDKNKETNTIHDFDFPTTILEDNIPQIKSAPQLKTENLTQSINQYQNNTLFEQFHDFGYQSPLYQTPSPSSDEGSIPTFNIQPCSPYDQTSIAYNTQNTYVPLLSIKEEPNNNLLSPQYSANSPYTPLSPASTCTTYSNNSSPNYMQPLSPLQYTPRQIKDEAAIDIEEFLKENQILQDSVAYSQSKHLNSSQQPREQNILIGKQEDSKPKDYQLLREVLQDTSFQKRFNLRPLNFDSLTSGFVPNSNLTIKMEEPDGMASTSDSFMTSCSSAIAREKIEPVLSLAIEQMRKDVDNTCSALGISQDPLQWSGEDVKAWLLWTLRQYSLPIVPVEYFSMDGARLAALSEQDFIQRAPQAGSTLYAQLEIWKAARQEGSAMGPSWGPSLHHTSATSNASSNEEASDEDDEDKPGKNGQSTSTGVGKAPSSKQGGSHIHLWQFLKELLASPQLHGSAIRWLDRSKGVFKIEDSVRVARLWGKRKNRPAMNYDKLSRSIRQYYKKGIMKKTERSQRLVYQFCHPYCL
ncbi:DNA-binding protein Ets98B isoform X2 [Arctopsyche grandis]